MILWNIRVHREAGFALAANRSSRLWPSKTVISTLDVKPPFWDELKRRYIGAAEQRLGVLAVPALEEGRGMTFDAAMDYALEAGRDEAPELKIEN